MQVECLEFVKNVIFQLNNGRCFYFYFICKEASFDSLNKTSKLYKKRRIQWVLSLRVTKKISINFLHYKFLKWLIWEIICLMIQFIYLDVDPSLIFNQLTMMLYPVNIDSCVNFLKWTYNLMMRKTGSNCDYVLPSLQL